MNIQIIQDTIEDLKNNPNACMTVGGASSLDGKFQIEESNPGKQLNIFIQNFYENELQDLNYIANQKQIEGKNISEMSFKEVCTMITFLIRSDRFVSGFLYQKVKDGTMLQLVERLKEELS